jgi:hypothetical protein
MKYVIAIFLVIIGILAFWGYYNRQRAESYCELWKNSQANTDFLINKRREDNEKALESDKRKTELEELVKLSSESCWNRVIPNSDSVLVRLHQD